MKTEHVEAELVSEKTAIVPGEPLTVALRLRMERGWHTYWQNPGDSGLPTKLDWNLPSGVSAGAIGLTRYWVEFPDDNPALAAPARFACIGAVDVAVDCHDEESDWEELRALFDAWQREEPGARVDGYGIPMGGAIEIAATGAVTHLGPAPKRLRLDGGRIVE